MTSSGKKGVAPSKTDLFCLFEYEARSFGIFLFAAITSKMKIIWNKIEHKKNIATPFLYKQYSSCTFTKRYPCIFSSFPPVGLERKHSPRIRIITLSICQIDKVWHHWVIFGWFSSYTGSFSRKAVKWGDSGKAERTVRRKVDL